MADTLGTEQFGSGRAFLVNGTDVQEVGLLRDVSVSFKATKKPLKSTKRYAVRNALTDQSIEGKVGAAKISGPMFATALGATPTTGRTEVVEETITLGGDTVSPTNVGTTFVEALTVVDAAGNLMTRVAATPTVGQYTVITAAGATKGQLGFHADEPAGAGKYTYRYTKATGKTFTIANAVIGAPTTYKLVLNNAYLSPGLTLTLNAVTIDNIDVNFKGEDWADVSFTFSAEADSAGNVAVMDYD